MFRPATIVSGVLIAMTALGSSALGQTATTGSVGCSAITQAAANGMTARIQADDNSINQPQSVTSLSLPGQFLQWHRVESGDQPAQPDQPAASRRGPDLQCRQAGPGTRSSARPNAA